MFAKPEVEAVRKLDFWTARRRHRSTASERAAVQDMVQMNPVYTIAGPVTAGFISAGVIKKVFYNRIPSRRPSIIFFGGLFCSSIVYFGGELGQSLLYQRTINKILELDDSPSSLVMKEIMNSSTHRDYYMDRYPLFKSYAETHPVNWAIASSQGDEKSKQSLTEGQDNRLPQESEDGVVRFRAEKGVGWLNSQEEQAVTSAEMTRWDKVAEGMGHVASGIMVGDVGTGSTAGVSGGTKGANTVTRVIPAIAGASTAVDSTGRVRVLDTFEGRVSLPRSRSLPLVGGTSLKTDDKRDDKKLVAKDELVISKINDTQ